MTTTPDETPDDQSPGDAFEEKDGDKTGVEIGMTEGEGSTFEPEEDPEGHTEP